MPAYSKYVSCPILFLTARIEDGDKVRGFPQAGMIMWSSLFSMAELEARVEAHLRREARKHFEVQVKFSGDLTVDFFRTVFILSEKRN